MKSLLRERDRSEIMARVGRLQPESTRQWGRMTPHGALCHLTDSFRAVLGDRASGSRETLMGRTVMRFLALSTPLPWPRGVPTMPEADQERGGTPPDEFVADRARLESAAADFVRRLDPRTMRHPIFGRMTRGEWGRWAYRHLDHHTRQFGL